MERLQARVMPPDAIGDAASRRTASVAVHLYIGTSGYSYAAWKGRFYPEKLPANRMLAYYAAHFPTVEINNTFYRMPTPPLLEAWTKQVPAAFQFALKAPSRITHVRRLVDVDKDLARFLDVSSVLSARRGPLLFQLPPNLHRDDTRLRDFLALLPPGLRVAFEFRHPSWFDETVYGLLTQHSCALGATETDEAESSPLVATAPFAYVRLRREEYSDAALAKWLDRLHELRCSEVFVYFKHEDEARGPEFATRMSRLAGDAVAA